MKLSTLSLAFIPCLIAAAVPAPLPPVGCVRVEVGAGGVSSISKAPRFAVTKVLDLTFTVLFSPSFFGDHMVDLKVFTPDGQLYRSMAVPINDGKRPAGERSVAGYPRPVRERTVTQVTRDRAAYAAVAIPFPVAGTDIVSSGLYGRWRVQAHFDDNPDPCAPATYFFLNP